MDIYTLLSSKHHNPRYLTRYIKFIQSRTKKDGIFEKHHICPRANDLFPEYSSFKIHPWNMIKLTPREHFIAHLLLWKTYGGSQLSAIVIMAGKNKKRSRLYNKLREEFIIKQSQLQKDKKRKPLSKEHRQKLSVAHKNRKPISEETRLKLKNKNVSEETRKRMSASQKGRIITPEARLKISESKRGKSLSTEHIEKLKIASKTRPPESIIAKNKRKEKLKGRNNPNYDHTIYHWKHEIYGYFIGTRHELKHNFPQCKIATGNLSLPIKYPHKNCKGWKCVATY